MNGAMARKPEKSKASPGARDTSGEAGRDLVASNRRAFHEYLVLDRYEAGMKLTGGEVKSLRARHCEISDAYAMVPRDEDTIYLFNLQIPEYAQASTLFEAHEPKRRRVLLMHRKEIEKLRDRMGREQGLTLIPLAVYFRRGFAKVELGLCKGKKAHDKREAIKARDAKRQIERRVKR
ncbi:MAG: SsrA-binding protein [Planctomycetes bacterium]|nr:SsrA-binding protein [Planctomycetota bacterium]